MRVVFIDMNFGASSTGRLVETLHERFQDFGWETFSFYGRGRSNRVQRSLKLVPAWRLLVMRLGRG